MLGTDKAYFFERTSIMDVNQIIQNPEAYARLTAGSYELLKVCDANQLLVVNPDKSAVRYEMMIWQDRIKMKITRDGNESKYACSKDKNDLTVNGNPIPQDDRRFLQAMVTIFKDIQDQKAGLMVPKDAAKANY